MPDYGVFVTFEKDPYGWGPMFPQGRFACSFQDLCVEWARGGSMRRLQPELGVPTEIYVMRYGFDVEPDQMVRMSYRDVRSVARSVVDEETIFEKQGVDHASFMQQLVDKETARRQDRP
jgi:hypothetical protein